MSLSRGVPLISRQLSNCVCVCVCVCVYLHHDNSTVEAEQLEIHVRPGIVANHGNDLITSHPGSKSKKILAQPAERSLSPAMRKPNRPVQPRPPPPLKHSANKSSSGGGTGSPRPSHSLKERVIHLLALKPQKRPDLVARLKKGL